MIQKISTQQTTYKYEILDNIYPINPMAYIDTGIVADNDTYLEVKYKTKGSANNYYCHLIGIPSVYENQLTNPAFRIYYHQLTHRLTIQQNTTGSLLNEYWVDDDTVWHTIKLDHDTLYFDNRQIGRRSVVWTTYNNDTMLLFAARTSADQGQYYVEYLKLGSGNSLVRDYVPAKRLSDNVIGLYDKINDVFCTNAGTGEFGGTSKSTPEYIDEPTGHVVYVNDIKFNGSSIGRIMLNGDVYWGGDAASTPPTPTHLLHGTTTLTGSGTFNIGINNTSYNSQKNVPVQYDNGEFWLDELPSSIGTITNLAGMFFDLSHVTSIDEFNLDTSQCSNWRAAFGGAGITSFGNISPDLSSCTNLHDGFHKFQGETLDLSRFHVPSTVTDVNGLFYNSPNLKHIDVSNWQLSSLISRDFLAKISQDQIVDVTMNNASEGTFETFKYALRRNYPPQTTAKIYRDGVTYVYNGSQWVIEQ